MELILEQIELDENISSENTFNIFFDEKTGLIHAIENDVPSDEAKEFVYGLVGNQDEIASEHRDEILAYCLSKVLPCDEVGLGDIFMHGKYVTLIDSKNTNLIDSKDTKKKKEIISDVIDIFDRIGIDTPQNFDEIADFIYIDVCESADPINWHSGDVAIAFRRWIQSKGENKGE
jgi:hypothetical protein